MKMTTGLTLTAVTAVVLVFPQGAFAEDSVGRAMVQRTQRIIAAYHSGQPRSNGMLRVVYFVPKDRDPLPGYAERFDRILNDVSDFYRDGLQGFGLETKGLPLERSDGKLVLHLVRGELPADRYHHESGDRTALEIARALKGTVDLDREHVLVFYALCRKESDGRYVFDAPYYGGDRTEAAYATQRIASCSTRRC